MKKVYSFNWNVMTQKDIIKKVTVEWRTKQGKEGIHVMFGTICKSNNSVKILRQDPVRLSLMNWGNSKRRHRVTGTRIVGPCKILKEVWSYFDWVEATGCSWAEEWHKIWTVLPLPGSLASLLELTEKETKWFQ